MTTPTVPPHSPDCPQFEQLVQAVLDREAAPASLDHPHPVSCDSCRALATACRRFLEGFQPKTLSAPSPDLTNCILAAAITDFRLRRRRRWATRLATAGVAASLVAAAVVWYSRMDVVHRELAQIVPASSSTSSSSPVSPVRVSAQLEEAKDALASITQHATEQVTPPRAMVPIARTMILTPESKHDGMETESSTDALFAISSGAQSSLEPMASTTRRAVDMLLRDFSFVSR